MSYMHKRLENRTGVLINKYGITGVWWPRGAIVKFKNKN